MGRAEKAPRLAICVGKDCRRHEAFDALMAELSDTTATVNVACLDRCSGPVVVVDPLGDAPVVLERVRTAKARRAIVKLLRNGNASATPIAKRTVSGKRRAKALRRLHRHLAR